MGWLGWLWLVSPFVLIGLISRDRPMQAWVASHYHGCRVTGWAGVVMMFLGAALGSSLLGTLMFIIGTPLVGLVVWLCDDRDDGGEGEPDGPPINWNEFNRSFSAYSRRRRPPRRPRTPSGV